MHGVHVTCMDFTFLRQQRSLTHRAGEEDKQDNSWESPSIVMGTKLTFTNISYIGIICVKIIVNFLEVTFVLSCEMY